MFRDLQLLEQMIVEHQLAFPPELLKDHDVVTVSTLCNEQSAGSKVGAGVPWPVPDK